MFLLFYGRHVGAPRNTGGPSSQSEKLFFLCLQMQTLCRAVEISITTSYSTSVKIFYRGLTEVFIASPFCDSVHEGQVKRNHLS